MHADLAREAEARELFARKQFEVFRPLKEGSNSKSVLSTRRLLTWKMADDRDNAKARLVARGYQEPDLKEGGVDKSGRVSLRSSCPQVIPLGALKIWKIWTLDIKNALLQADGLRPDAYLCASAQCDPSNSHRIRKLRAPAYGSDGAPVAFRVSPQRFYLNLVASMTKEGLQFRASPFDPLLYFVLRKDGGAVGAIPTHTDDILGCGEPDVLSNTRVFLEHRFGRYRFRSRPLCMQTWKWPGRAISRLS